MADQDGLLLEALRYEQGHPRRSGHILKVTALAGLIGREEGLSEEEQMILEGAAILHDIGIKSCKEKYGSADQGNLATESERLARRFLDEYGYPGSWIERIVHLVRGHHDYEHIDSREYQILVEADLWVGAQEGEWSLEKKKSMEPYFRTDTGKDLYGRLLIE